MSRIPSFATIDPFDGMTADNPGVARSLVAGSWIESSEFLPDVPDPMAGGGFLKIPDTTDIEPFINSLKTCPKSGMHNPQKNPQRYIELGQVCAKAAALLADPEIQLDLARAYISMGDKEAARVILDEVEANGSEEQRAEAKKMLELLAH